MLPATKWLPEVSAYIYQNLTPNLSVSFVAHMSMLIHQKCSRLLAILPIAQPGRKMVAGFVMTFSDNATPTVVTIGTGTKCVERDKLS